MGLAWCSVIFLIKIFVLQGYQGYDFKRNLEHSWSSFGEYSTDIFTEEAEEIIKSHNKNFPLFLYIAHLAVHAPLQAPQELIDTFQHIKQEKRRIFAGNIKLVYISIV